MDGGKKEIYVELRGGDRDGAEREGGGWLGVDERDAVTVVASVSQDGVALN